MLSTSTSFSIINMEHKNTVRLVVRMRRIDRCRILPPSGCPLFIILETLPQKCGGKAGHPLHRKPLKPIWKAAKKNGKLSLKT
ncbi:hypothetical protein DSY2615 [Desulfitobacterium hafniense Y51]|uniref:Uncharacterized protein n=1 Tax=Desulfitobacterium hafniense (strain Y51) TaxID=138119 RepID=Q24U88_DESHY|nr:hypothetical protein DSY2615 [Desulfitobacterium hafniense Y51]